MVKLTTVRQRTALGGLLLALLWFFSAAASAAVLEAVEYANLPGDMLQVRLGFSGAPPKPGTFTMDSPARIAIDLPDTVLGEVKRTTGVNSKVARAIRAVQAGTRSRVVIDLTQLVPFNLRAEDNSLFIELQTGAQAPAVERAAAQPNQGKGVVRQVTNIDFRRTESGDGRLVIKLSDPGIPIDLQEKDGRIVVDFMGAKLPELLERRLDVTDFATAVNTIDAFNRNGNVRMVIAPKGNYSHLSYQVGDTYTIDVKTVTEQEKRAAQQKAGDYSGEKLSLNFQNIDVRAVLQLIADFTSLNIIASDTVQGNITLRLKNVPWDQALDIILRSKGLAMRKSGNVIMVAPAEEIATREKAELQAQQQKEELVPLRTEFFQINYAKAADIAALLKAETNSLLSKRGNVTLDERTNTLMILDNEERLTEIRRIINSLDIPVRQVLIETRVVIANDDFSRSLGARFGVTNVATNGANGVIATTGSAVGTSGMVSSAVTNLGTNGSALPVTLPGVNDRFNVNLPVTNPAGKLALAILGSDYLVDLELSALEQEGRGDIVSNPRVITANQKEAVIEQGVEIPYQQATSSGATSVSFKKAVLSLTVTPQITPDDRVIMDLKVSKDSVGLIYAGVPSIDKREVNTQVLVNNGDTVVLGGIYEQTRSDQVDKVPLLGDLPVVGALFRQSRKVDKKAELLIFVTPKILKEGLTATKASR